MLKYLRSALRTLTHLAHGLVATRARRVTAAASGVGLSVVAFAAPSFAVSTVTPQAEVQSLVNTSVSGLSPMIVTIVGGFIVIALLGWGATKVWHAARGGGRARV